MSLQVDWQDLQSSTHYHIQWPGKDSLDWERFDTCAAAAEWAQRPGESYAIKQQGANCPACALVRALAASRSVSRS